MITGSHDSTIKLWDLAAGKAMTTLTHHKKSVRAMCMHPKEFTFASASADNIKKFVLPRGNFLHNMLSNQRTILNSMAVNEDGIMATGGDNGSLWFWDWKSGHCFQVHCPIPIPIPIYSPNPSPSLTLSLTLNRGACRFFGSGRCLLRIP